MTMKAIEKKESAYQPAVRFRAGTLRAGVAAAVVCIAMPSWALGVSVGGIDASVDVDIGGGGVDVGVDVGVGGGSGGVNAGVDVGVGGGGVDAGVDVSLGGGSTGGGGSGGPGTGGPGTGGPGTGGPGTGGPGVVAGVDEDGKATFQTTASTSGSLACAKDGNQTAYNGFALRDRDGDVVGWVHDATVSPDNRLMTLRVQSTSSRCYKLSGAGMQISNGEVWSNVDGDAIR